jgi:predicted ATP-grasp superfamily ATP-dependent carboligase
MTIPVLILGGAENALAVARSLSRYGVPVSVSTQASQAVRWSRCFKHGFFSAPHVPIQDYWTELLLRSETASGSIILTCSDDAVQFVAANHEALRRHYIL